MFLVQSQQPLKNATVAHWQQANQTNSESSQNFKNSATMDNTLKHQIIETILDTNTEELRKKYTGFMGVNTTDMVHHLIDIYGKIT